MTRRACGTAVVLLFVSLATPVRSQQYYLYSPKQLSPQEKAQAKEGVLVREVPVQKGDTLFGISRKFSGHGSYYPQILLFNDIKDPNLICPGNVVKVPVTKAQAAEVKGKAQTLKKQSAEQPAEVVKKAQTAVSAPSQKKAEAGKTPSEPLTELSLNELKRVDAGKHKKHGAKKKSAACPPKRAKGEKQHAATKVARKPASAVHAPIERQPHPSRVDTTSGQKLFEMAVKSYRQDDCRTALDLFDRFLTENSSSPLAADASLYKAECYLKLSSQ